MSFKAKRMIEVTLVRANKLVIQPPEDRRVILSVVEKFVCFG